MSKIEVSFFELGEAIYKKVSIKRDAESVNITCTIYDDLGVIRDNSCYTFRSSNIISVTKLTHGVAVKHDDGMECLI
jgi:hypothetical protein